MRDHRATNRPTRREWHRLPAGAKGVASLLLFALLLTAVGIALAQPPAIEITIDAAKIVGESAGTVTMKVKLSAASSETITVQYDTVAGTAEADTDYEAKSATLVFAPDEIEKTITINIVGDAIEELEETFTVDLSSPTGNASLSTSAWQCVVTIIDDDGPLPTVQFEQTLATVSEGVIGGDAVSVTLTVSLSAKAPTPVTVKYATKDWPLVNGASAGSDYTATSGTLTFKVGETSNTITIPILPDEELEFAESFSMELSDPQGATLGSK